MFTPVGQAKLRKSLPKGRCSTAQVTRVTMLHIQSLMLCMLLALMCGHPGLVSYRAPRLGLIAEVVEGVVCLQASVMGYSWATMLERHSSREVRAG